MIDNLYVPMGITNMCGRTMTAQTLEDLPEKEQIKQALTDNTDVIRHETVTNHAERDIYVKVYLHESTSSLNLLLDQHDLQIRMARVTDAGNLQVNLGAE